VEYKAKLKYVKMSARKVRRVADLIKGKGVDEALETLYFTPKAAANPLMRTLKSATSNAISSEGSAKIKAEDLFIKEISVDGGPIMKRIRPAPMGRAYRVRKRTSHINLKLGIRPEKIKAIEKEEAKSKSKKKGK
jgi:large subunit ribosomal protein L22